MRIRSGLWLLWILTTCHLLASGQESVTRNESWPEVNVYVNIDPKVRLFLIGTASKSVEDGEILRGDAYEAQFGVHVDYMPKNYLSLRTGYRFGTSVGGHEDFKEHRVLAEQTLRKRLPSDVLLSDRNREDFRFINGDFSFRYRNRVTLEREFQISRRRMISPYASAEAFFDTRYDVWNKTRFAFGAQLNLTKGPLKELMPRHQTLLDVYYMRVHDTRSSTTYVNGLGIVLSLYF